MTQRSYILTILSFVGVECTSHYGTFPSTSSSQHSCQSESFDDGLISTAEYPLIDIPESEDTDNDSCCIPQEIFDHISGFTPCSALKLVNRMGYAASEKTAENCSTEINQRFESLLNNTNGTTLNMDHLNVFEPAVVLNLSSIKLTLFQYLKGNHVNSGETTTWKGIESNTDNLFLLSLMTRSWPPIKKVEDKRCYRNGADVGTLAIVLIIFDGHSMRDNSIKMHVFQCSLSHRWLCSPTSSISVDTDYAGDHGPVSLAQIERLIKERSILIQQRKSDGIRLRKWHLGRIPRWQLIQAQDEVLGRRRTCLQWVCIVIQCISLLLMFQFHHDAVHHVAMACWTACCLFWYYWSLTSNC